MSQKSQDAITITPTQAIIPHPLRSLWEMADQPTLSSEDYNLTVCAMRLTGQDTVLLYSITGAEPGNLEDLRKNVQLLDNSGNISDVISAGTLATIGNIEFGYLKFSPRTKGARELFLHIVQGSSKTGFADIPLAQFVNPPEDPSFYNIRTYLLGTGQIVEQGNLSLSFVGWTAPSPYNVSVTPSVGIPADTSGDGEVDTGIQVTATPYVITPVATTLPKGISVTDEATIKIVDNNGQTYYIYVQFLSDGEIISQLIK